MCVISTACTLSITYCIDPIEIKPTLSYYKCRQVIWSLLVFPQRTETNQIYKIGTPMYILCRSRGVVMLITAVTRLVELPRQNLQL